MDLKFSSVVCQIKYGDSMLTNTQSSTYFDPNLGNIVGYCVTYFQ